MKSFIQFLKEYKIDDELSLQEEKYFRFNESGEIDGFEGDQDNSIDWHDFSEFFENETKTFTENLNEDKASQYGKKGTTFGGETIIDLDFGDDTITESRKKKEEPEETEDVKDTETVNYLKTHTIGGIEDVQKNAFKFKVYPENGIPEGDNALSISVRKYTEPEESRHVLSKEEAMEIVNHMNEPPPPPKKFEFKQDGTFTSNGRVIPRHQKTHFLKKLNTFVENEKKIKGDTNQRHYKWEIKGDVQKYTEKDQQKNKKHIAGMEIAGSQFGDRLMYNLGVNKWDDSDTENLKKYDVDKYEVIQPGSDQEKELIGYIQKVQKSAKNTELYGWDDKLQTFTLVKLNDNDQPVGNPKPIIGQELLDFLKVRNAHMTMDKTQGGPNGEKGKNSAGSYWRHFKISMTGSKVGDVANFSLPPVMTCNRDAPCINDGCYAVKAFGIYPTSRIAQEVNYALLKGKGGYKQFEEEIGKVLALSKKNGDGSKSPRFEYFRFFVSGDMISKEMLDSICNIARSHKINFWMYTKQYKILHDYTGDIPSNLTILVSCWGEFNPKMYKLEESKEKDENGNPIAPYADLAEKFPLAYLDDGTEATHKYFEKKPGDEVCPCTEDDEVIARCDTCHKCFSVKAGKGNIIFKKH